MSVGEREIERVGGGGGVGVGGGGSGLGHAPYIRHEQMTPYLLAVNSAPFFVWEGGMRCRC